MLIVLRLKYNIKKIYNIVIHSFIFYYIILGDNSY